ncbi:MAG: radical SAM family heme chaperone HemW [Verrucomicrobiaceae bacterium]|nr:radical SAM family heme chaperone HemW [Verrucomicrobiaceae bacterium]
MVRHLYIHVPFCHRICPYCNFYKHTPGGTDHGAFVRSLLDELKERSSEYDLRPDTIYLGGGTPTALSSQHLGKLLEGITNILETGNLIEWDIEANPATFNHGKAQLMRNAGITRVSLGIQSWTPATLTTLGRDHSPEDARAAFETLRSCEFPSLNIDMMFSIPGQSPQSWLSDLEYTLKLNPDHVSAYNLNYEEDTEFFERLHKGEFRENAEHDIAFFTDAMEILGKAGFDHYEISNYAKPGHYSKHNSAYWSGADYLGIGPGAFSTVNRTRWRNVADTGKYITTVSSGNITGLVTERETINDSAFRAERIALQLRTSGGLKKEILGHTRKNIPELADEGLIEDRNERVFLTDKGKLLADSVASHLL